MPQVMTQEVFKQVPVPVMKSVDVPVPTPVVRPWRVVEVLSHRSWKTHSSRAFGDDAGGRARGGLSHRRHDNRRAQHTPQDSRVAQSGSSLHPRARTSKRQKNNNNKDQKQIQENRKVNNISRKTEGKHGKQNREQNERRKKENNKGQQKRHRVSGGGGEKNRKNKGVAEGEGFQSSCFWGLEFSLRARSTLFAYATLTQTKVVAYHRFVCPCCAHHNQTSF